MRYLRTFFLLLMHLLFLFPSLINLKLPTHKTLIRKEIRDLTPDEWTTYRNGILKLKKHGFFEELADIHVKADKYAHNTPRFLPWHRAFLLYFENLLQIVTNNYDLTVPYWDWTLDCDDPGSSLIFKERFWGLKTCYEMYYPEKHCLKRNDSSIDPFYGKAQINRLINQKMSYDKFRESLELVPHAIVHFNVGGKDGDMSNMFSTNDPIFWHHHSYVDYIWHKKQVKNLNNQYNGKDADINELLKPFNKTVRDVMSLDNCKRAYKEFVPVGIMSMNLKPSKISEEYAMKHGYDIQRVREIESFMTGEEREEGFIKRFLWRLFNLKFF